MTAIATAGTAATKPGQLFDLDKLDREEALRRRMIHDLPISERAAVALWAIAETAADGGLRDGPDSFCEAAKHALQRRAGQSEATFKRALRDLEGTPWLSIDVVTGRANLYTVHWGAIFAASQPTTPLEYAPRSAADPTPYNEGPAAPPPAPAPSPQGAITGHSRRVVVTEDKRPPAPVLRVSGSADSKVGSKGGSVGGSYVIKPGSASHVCMNDMNESKDSFVHNIHEGVTRVTAAVPSTPKQARAAAGGIKWPHTDVEQLRDPAWVEQLWRRTVGAGKLPDTHEWRLWFYAIAHHHWRCRSEYHSSPVGFFLNLIRQADSRAGRNALLQQKDDEHDLAWAKSVLCPDTRPRLSEGERESQEVRERDQRKRELRQQMKQVAATFGAK